jgi:pyrrolidone-carboxylate peptidase
MKIFIYGFKPYQHFSENITETLVNSLPRLSNVSRHVFQVEFNYEMFISKLRYHKPDMIIGLGQHPRARKLRIERKSKNLYKTEDGKSHVISKDSPEYLFANFKLDSIEGTTTTYDAGTYVCNFSMYLMCEYAIKNNVKFAFLHVPVSIDKTFLLNYLAGQISDREANLNQVAKS